MPMIGNPLKSLSKPKLTSQYLTGYVINNVDKDDNKHLQRVQVRCAVLHRNIPDDKLPWCIPDVSYASYANAGGGVGNANIPPIGSKIYLILDDPDDTHNPRYSGSPSSDDVNKDNELFKEDYPHTRGAIDAAGNRTATNVEKNTQDQVHVSGTTIHIDANGSVSINSASDLNLAAQGNINMVASGEVKIDGAKIHLNGGNAATATTARTRPTIPSRSGQTTA